jgi:Aldehyde dehydrogenase family
MSKTHSPRAPACWPAASACQAWAAASSSSRPWWQTPRPTCCARARKPSAPSNATEFGLASYFYSRDIGRIYRVGEALEYGMVGVNVGVLATEHVPFGGVKQSGLGREGSHFGMDDYVEIKYLCIGDILR